MKETMKVNIDIEKGTGPWYARQAIRAMSISQRQAFARSFSSIFGAYGAAIEGDVEQVERLIAEGESYLTLWSALAREYSKKISKTVQTSPATPITKLPEVLEEPEATDELETDESETDEFAIDLVEEDL